MAVSVLLAGSGTFLSDNRSKNMRFRFKSPLELTVNYYMDQNQHQHLEKKNDKSTKYKIA